MGIEAAICRPELGAPILAHSPEEALPLLTEAEVKEAARRIAAVVNRLRTQVFHDAPMFTDNNDDLGALSSELVWSMLGFYPEIPGSAQLVLNGPEFPI